MELKFVETSSSSYAQRTHINASADATLAFANNFFTTGEIATKKFVLDQKKLYIPIHLNDDLSITPELINDIVNKFNENEVKSVNIAGNGIYTLKSKFTQEQVDDFIYLVLDSIKNGGLNNPIELIRSGGQSGADEAGIKAGIKLNIDTLVTLPKGYRFRNENGEDIINETQFKERFPIVDSSEPETT